ncbi:nucleotide exchange factor GrpE [bacterium]|nr:MAG: nucleotide exchange factor GrpE [bacterium]
MAENKLQPKSTTSAEAGSAPEEGATNDANARNPASIAEQLEAALPTLHRFRLPKFFSNTEGADEDETEEELEPNDLEVGLLPDAPAVVNGNRNGSSSKINSPESISTVNASADELALVQMQLEELTDQIRQVNEREGAMEKVFNTLHSELADYKNDFLYEHLKPVVRPLLFLFDSLEQFDGEVSMAESTLGQTAQGGVLSPSVVRENVRYFRDQLVEALRVCEVVIMDPPTGNYSAKFHKAVDIVPVGSEEDGKIVRVVRSGWFLNGQLLRPAEVVIGKFRPQS